MDTYTSNIRIIKSLKIRILITGILWLAAMIFAPKEIEILLVGGYYFYK